MIPQRIEDPRDKLEKADRFVLVKYAAANGIVLDDRTPKIVTEQILRAKGLTNPPIDESPLGYPSNYGMPVQPALTGGQSINAVDDFMRQYEQQKANPDPAPTPKQEPIKTGSKINEMRWECKRRGIKLSRRDNLKSLHEKLNGSKNAS